LRPNDYYIDGCDGVLLSDTEDSTRIGELHVAGSPDDVEGTYSYSTAADSDLSVGFSSSSDTGPWSSGGTYDMTNSIGSGGSVTHTNWYLYTDSHVYYGQFAVYGCPGIYYMTAGYDAVGDVYDGINHPGINPYGYCDDDPNGYATVNIDGGTYFTQRQQAANYSVVAQLFGFSFSGTTGYSSTNEIEWVNNSPTYYSFVCGTSLVNESPILYNSVQ
jgi:hypothetical protein